MKWAWGLMLVTAISVAHGAAAPFLQSLAEVARKEAERRQKIDQQGIPVKRIESADLSSPNSGGRISVSSLESGSKRLTDSPAKTEARPTLRSFQTRLQKLDSEISQAEEKLKLLRARADAERWTVVKTPKGSRGAGLFTGQDKFRQQILEAEARLTALRRDRSDVFQAGRKAGYLPGELEGRGIVR